MTQDKLKVEQASREAAVEFIRGAQNIAAVRAGKADGLPIVQAFARHRKAAMIEAAGMLEKKADTFGDSVTAKAMAEIFREEADAIRQASEASQ